jgi:hypothetical protein
MPGGTRIPFTGGMRYDETAVAVRERVGELVIGRRFTGPPTTANGLGVTPGPVEGAGHVLTAAFDGGIPRVR